MSETTAVPNNNNVQKTLVVFKPDAVQRGIVGEILTRFGSHSNLRSSF